MVFALAATLTVGATVQGLVGLGLGLVSAPIAVLIAPSLMPDLLLWLAAMLPLVTLIRDHEDIDWRGLAWAVSARVPGTVVGVALVAAFSENQLGLAVGSMVLLSVVLSVWAIRFPVNRATLVGAGFVSGMSGTATSIGGPPLAVLYQHRSPAQIRSTLAVYFVMGALISLTGLGLVGALAWRDFVFALLMVPFLFAGLYFARRLRRRVDARHTRAAVLLLCALSSVVLIVRSVL